MMKVELDEAILDQLHEYRATCAAVRELSDTSTADEIMDAHRVNDNAAIMLASMLEQSVRYAEMDLSLAPNA